MRHKLNRQASQEMSHFWPVIGEEAQPAFATRSTVLSRGRLAVRHKLDRQASQEMSHFWPVTRRRGSTGVRNAQHSAE